MLSSGLTVRPEVGLDLETLSTMLIHTRRHNEQRIQSGPKAARSLWPKAGNISARRGLEQHFQRPDAHPANACRQPDWSYQLAQTLNRSISLLCAK